MSSIRDASTTSSSNPPSINGLNSPNSNDVVSDAETASAPGATSFLDQERHFLDKQENRRRRMDRTIGNKTIEAAGPLDDDGGKTVTHAAAKAKVMIPPKHMLIKVERAVREHPQMKTLQNYVSAGLHAENLDILTPAATQKMQGMAAGIAHDSGLIDGDMAAAFGAPKGAGAKAVASPAGAAGASAPAGATLQLPQAQNDATPDGTPPGQVPLGASNADSAPGAASDASSPAWLASGNIATIMMLVCTASMSEDNKIKAGRINDMQKYNKISAVIADYISNTLQPAQAALDKKTEGKKADDASQARVPVETWSHVDVDTLLEDANSNFSVPKQVESERLSNTGLGTALSTAQNWATTASNNSEQASNRFQAVDNRTNQTFTMLTGVLKNMNDSQASVIRNIA